MRKRSQSEENLLEFKLDVWQNRVIRRKGNMVLCCGRQTGKSTVVSLKAHKLAIDYPGTTTLVIAATQRQAGLLFEKIRGIFDIQDRKFFEKNKKVFSTKAEEKEWKRKVSVYAEEPTMTAIRLKNGSRIYCHPAGRTGSGIRGFTIDFLVADEAARIPDEVWVSVTPMLATSKKARGTGWMILLSTPWGKRGYFYDAFHDSDFMPVHVRSDKCRRIPKKFLAKERRKMTKLNFQQEYLALFIEAVRQFFPTKWINKSAVLEKPEEPEVYGKYYLGVDFARYGGDENAFVIMKLDEKNLRGVWVETAERVSTIDPIGRIINLDKVWHFKKIFVDSGGLGAPILDVLQERLGSKVVGLDNSQQPYVAEEGRKRKILKEDLYSNALLLMENEQVRFLNHAALKSSLKSITFEYGEEGRVKIKGKGSHLCEAFVRATWCIKNKGLDLFLA